MSFDVLIIRQIPPIQKGEISSSFRTVPGCRPNPLGVSDPKPHDSFRHDFVVPLLRLNSFRHDFVVPPPSKREVLSKSLILFKDKSSLLEGAVSEAD